MSSKILFLVTILCLFGGIIFWITTGPLTSLPWFIAVGIYTAIFILEKRGEKEKL